MFVVVWCWSCDWFACWVLSCMYKIVGSLFGMSYCLLQEKIVAITVKLTQAGMSRLGKINRGSPKYFSMNGRPGDPLYFLSERMSRLGEEGLASENACKVPILEVELSPRQRELAWARVLLAWARLFCLSEMLGEKVVGLDVFLDFKSGQHACMSITFNIMNWMAFMNEVGYELWFVSFNMMWAW